MSRKKTVEAREVTVLKLEEADQYIRFFEEMISRVEIGKIKIDALHGESDLLTWGEERLTRPSSSLQQLRSADPLLQDGESTGSTNENRTGADFLQRELRKLMMGTEKRTGAGLIQKAMEVTKLSGTVQVTPSWSLIEEDLQRIECELGPDHVESMEQHIRILALSHAVIVVERQRGTSNLEACARAALEATNRFVAAFKLRLSVAKRLRNELIQRLNQDAAESQRKTSAKKGRPKDPLIAKRNARMVEAWDTRSYATYVELGRKFDCTEDTARKVITRAKRERGRKARPDQP